MKEYHISVHTEDNIEIFSFTLDEDDVNCGYGETLRAVESISRQIADSIDIDYESRKRDQNDSLDPVMGVE